MRTESSKTIDVAREVGFLVIMMELTQTRAPSEWKQELEVDETLFLRSVNYP